MEKDKRNWGWRRMEGKRRKGKVGKGSKMEGEEERIKTREEGGICVQETQEFIGHEYCRDHYSCCLISFF